MHLKISLICKQKLSVKKIFLAVIPLLKEMLKKVLRSMYGKFFDTQRASRVKATTPEREGLSNKRSYQSSVNVG
jgi:hypothetical protein